MVFEADLFDRAACRYGTELFLIACEILMPNGSVELNTAPLGSLLLLGFHELIEVCFVEHPLDFT